MKKMNRVFAVLFWILTVACMGVIFYLSAQSASDSSALSQGVVSKIFVWFNLLLGEEFIRETAHGVEYLGLAVLAFPAFYFTKNRTPHPFLALALCSAYAVTDEIHQIFSPGRACQLMDWGIDTIGAALGIAFCMVLYWLTHLKRKSKS